MLRIRASTTPSLSLSLFSSSFLANSSSYSTSCAVQPPQSMVSLLSLSHSIDSPQLRDGPPIAAGPPVSAPAPLLAHVRDSVPTSFVAMSATRAVNSCDVDVSSRAPPSSLFPSLLAPHRHGQGLYPLAGFRQLLHPRSVA